jgi:hypothetical protein
LGFWVFGFLDPPKAALGMFEHSEKRFSAIKKIIIWHQTKPNRNRIIFLFHNPPKMRKTGVKKTHVLIFFLPKSQVFSVYFATNKTFWRFLAPPPFLGSAFYLTPPYCVQKLLIWTWTTFLQHAVSGIIKDAKIREMACPTVTPFVYVKLLLLSLENATFTGGKNS